MALRAGLIMKPYLLSDGFILSHDILASFGRRAGLCLPDEEEGRYVGWLELLAKMPIRASVWWQAVGLDML